MTSDSEEDGLEDLESEGDYDEDENVLIGPQEDETEDSDEVCTYSRIPFTRLSEPININFRNPQKGRRMKTTMRMRRRRRRKKRKKKRKRKKRKNSGTRGSQST